MKCANCGADLVADALSCVWCGEKVVRSEEEMVALARSSVSLNESLASEPPTKENEAKRYVRSLRMFVKENQDYYLSKWRKMDNSEGIKSKISWNWGAFCFGVFWLGYRKLYLSAFIWSILSGVIIYLSSLQYISDNLSALLVLFIGLTPAVLGNHIYRVQVDHKLTGIKSKYPDERTQDIVAAKSGGRDPWGVFTVCVVVLLVMPLTWILLAGIGLNTSLQSNNQASESASPRRKGSISESQRNTSPNSNYSWLPSNIALVADRDSTVVVKGTYAYSNDVYRDAQRIVSDIWTIAKNRPRATEIDLTIIFVGVVNTYGESTTQELTAVPIDDLDDVRRHVSASYYYNGSSGGVRIISLLKMNYYSPYHSW